MSTRHLHRLRNRRLLLSRATQPIGIVDTLEARRLFAYSSDAFDNRALDIGGDDPNFSVLNPNVLTADFTGDGINDIFTRGFFYDYTTATGEVRAYLSIGNGANGVGDGTFQPKVATTVGPDDFLGEILPGDFDGDGDRDVLLVPPDAYSNSPAYLLTNNGAGQFTPSTVNGIRGIARVGRVDAGLSDDVVTSDAGMLNLFLGGSGGTTITGTPSDSITISGPTFFDLKDVTGEGRADIIRQENSSNPLQSIIDVFPGQADGTLGAQIQSTVTASVNLTTGFAVGDVDGDGDQDLILQTSSYGDDIVVGLNNGAGDFSVGSASGFFTGSVISSNLVASLDLNGDNITDFITRSDLILSKGNFTYSQIHLQPGLFRVANVTDLNGDGKVDLVMSSGSLAYVAFNDGNNGFPRQTDPDLLAVPTGGDPEIIVSADFNGDGRADFASVDTTFSSGTGITVVLGQANGTVTGPASPTVYPTFANGNAGLAVGFVDDDLIPDLITASTYGGQIAVFRGKGDGTFLPAVLSDFNQTSGAFNIVAGDFNKDGKTDVALSLSKYEQNHESAPFQVLLSIGGGKFGAPAEYTGADVGTIVVGDFNADTRDDLLVIDYYNNFSKVFLSNPDGTFAAPTVVTLPIMPAGTVVTGKFDGDTFADLALFGYDSSEEYGIFILKGDGASGFSLVEMIADPHNIKRLITADLNKDAKADLLVTDGTIGSNSASGPFSVYFGAGDGTFGEPVYYSTPYPSGAFAVGDVNGDGAIDVVYDATNSSSGGSDGLADGFSVVTNLGSGVFDAAVHTPLTTLTPSEYADFDGDGTDDLVIAEYDNTLDAFVLRPRQGLQSGNFAPLAQTTPLNFGFNALIAGDVNGDGKQDLVAQEYGGNFYHILLSNGDFTFTESTVIDISSFNSGFSVDSLFFGDVDGDQKDDFIFTDASNPGLLVFRSTQFGSPTLYNLSFSPDSVLVENLTSDGFKELIVNSNDAFYTLINNGAGLFLPPTEILPPNPNTDFVDLAVGDFDGDGDNDVAALTSNDSTQPYRSNVQLFTNDGSGVLALGIASTFIAVSAEGLQVGDFTGDGKPDLLTTGYEPAQETGELILLASNGAGRFDATLRKPIPGDVSGFAVGFIDGDAKPDVFYDTYSSNRGANVLLSTGAGTLFSPPVTPNNFPVLAVAIGPAVTPDQTLADGDFNGDGRLDFVGYYSESGQNRDSNVGIFLSNGDGTFNATGFALLASTIALTTGDFNGDGKLDLASVLRVSGSFYNNSIAIFLGNGDGTFQIPIPTSIPTSVPGATVNDATVDIYAANLNGDAFTDLVYANYFGNTLYTLLGNGTGNFAPAVSVDPASPGTQQRLIGIENFTSDGTPDLLIAVGNTQTLTLYSGDGDGTFTVGNSLGIDNIGPGDVAIGNVGGDAKPDIVLITQPSNENQAIFSLINDGLGSFNQVKSPLPFQLSPSNLTLADIDLDKILDLIVSSSGGSGGSDGAFALAYGNGDGSFATPEFYVGSGYVAVGDFNGDQSPDVLLNNPYGYGTSGVFVVLSNVDLTPPGATLTGFGAPAAGATFLDFTIVYDDIGGIDTTYVPPAVPNVTIPGGQNVDVGVISSALDDPNHLRVVYRLSLPGGVALPSGTYTLNLPAGLARDNAGNVRAQQLAISSFDYNSDTAAPTAALAGNVSSPALGATEIFFTVNFTDDTGFGAGGITSSAVRVLLPDGVTEVTPELVSTTGSGTSITATFRLPAPGGSFTLASNGTYNIVAPAGGFVDALNNPSAFQNLGSFTLAFVEPKIGGLDAGFGGGTGIVTVTVPDATLVSLDSFTSGAGILTTGFDAANNMLVLAKFNADGSYDAAFGAGGIFRTPMPAGINVTKVQFTANGDIYLLGTNAANQPAIARFNQSGQQDTGFGIVTLAPFAAGDRLNSIAIVTDKSGAIVNFLAGGTATVNGTKSVVIAFLNTDGSLNTKFGEKTTAGFYTRPVTDIGTVNYITLDAKGNIFATGSQGSTSDASLFVVSLLKTGKINKKFAEQTFKVNNFLTVGQKVNLTASGKTFKVLITAALANSAADAAAGRFGSALVRFTDTGNLDTTLNNSGFTILGAPPTTGSALSSRKLGVSKLALTTVTDINLAPVGGTALVTDSSGQPTKVRSVSASGAAEDTTLTEVQVVADAIDIQVGALSAKNAKPFKPGKPITASVTLSNIGTLSTPKVNVPVSLYLSTDNTLDVNTDTKLTLNPALTSLLPGKSKKINLKFNAPTTPGTYFIFAVTNDGQSAFSEVTIANNTSTGPDITVQGAAAIKGNTDTLAPATPTKDLFADQPILL